MGNNLPQIHEQNEAPRSSQELTPRDRSTVEQIDGMARLLAARAIEVDSYTPDIESDPDGYSQIGHDSVYDKWGTTVLVKDGDGAPGAETTGTKLRLDSPTQYVEISTEGGVPQGALKDRASDETEAVLGMAHLRRNAAAALWDKRVELHTKKKTTTTSGTHDSQTR